MALFPASSGGGGYCSKLISASSLSDSSFLSIACVDDNTNKSFTPKLVFMYAVLSSTDTRIVKWDIKNSTIEETYQGNWERNVYSSLSQYLVVDSGDNTIIKYKTPSSAWNVQTRFVIMG